MNAVMTPEVILSPLVFEATLPRVWRAARTMRVVVDLPLVPVMTALGMRAARSASTVGDRRRATSPPIMPPEPRPSRREAVRAPAPAARATRERNGIRGV